MKKFYNEFINRISDGMYISVVMVQELIDDVPDMILDKLIEIEENRYYE